VRTIAKADDAGEIVDRVAEVAQKSGDVISLTQVAAARTTVPAPDAIIQEAHRRNRQGTRRGR
jgi:hypothetical protein